MTRPDWFRIVVCGVGGQGVLLTSRVLCEAARSAGLPVVSGEIRNMAQRGGAVLATVVTGGARSTVVPRGGADVVLGLEPMETARTAAFMGAQTVVLTNTHPIVPFTLSVRGRPYPPVDRLLEPVRRRCGDLFSLDATKVAVELGSIRVLNTVMLGVLAARSRVPIGTDVLEKTIADESPMAHSQLNVDAFRAGIKCAAIDPAKTETAKPRK